MNQVGKTRAKADAGIFESFCWESEELPTVQGRMIKENIGGWHASIQERESCLSIMEPPCLPHVLCVFPPIHTYRMLKVGHENCLPCEISFLRSIQINKEFLHLLVIFFPSNFCSFGPTRWCSGVTPVSVLRGFFRLNTGSCSVVSGSIQCWG